MKMTASNTALQEPLSETVLDNIGQNIFRCYQCVKCSSGCPLADHFDIKPNQVMRSLQLNDPSVLESKAIWLCAGCQTCATRCPQEIKVTDIMYILKRMAIRENRQRSKKARALSKAFVDIVNRNGRNQETELMVRFMLTANPLGAISAAPIGLSLYTHGRLPLTGKRIQDINGLRKIVATRGRGSVSPFRSCPGSRRRPERHKAKQALPTGGSIR